MEKFPNRCQHLKVNGTQCGSPALRRNRFCYFHKLYQDERIKLSADRARRGAATFVLPVLEDANSIQIALMQVVRLLVSQQIDHKTASLLLYALQTASTNLRMTNFDPGRHDVILDPRHVADTQLNERVWEDEDFDDPEEIAAAEALENARRLEASRDRQAQYRREIAELERLTKARAETSCLERDFGRPLPRPTNPASTVNAAGNARPAPATAEKKPVGKTIEEVRESVRQQARQGLFDMGYITADGTPTLPDRKKGGQVCPPHTTSSKPTTKPEN
jgi:hypothetical protein